MIPHRDRDTMTAALKPFGWTCGPEFWQRYHTDPWVFHLANVVEKLTERLAAAEQRCWKLQQGLTCTCYTYHEPMNAVCPLNTATDKEGTSNETFD